MVSPRIRIVSGGQTGVDRAALDVALKLQLPAGGWCPLGRLAEDGTVPAGYPLQETPTADYAERTEWNVRDSDGTLILYRGRLRGGTELTRQLAARYGRPCKTVDLEAAAPPLETRLWIATCGIRTLNLAGPRESQSSGISAQARRYLTEVLSSTDPEL